MHTASAQPVQLHGILNLYKPVGPTSHDCIYRVRRAYHTRRAGHAGTLDPMASGVLVVGIGHGTRILEYLQGFPKVYRAGIRFGVETDSQDTTGAVVATQDAATLTAERVQDALERFRGDILQVPPMVSALKVGGKKLYELARRGETVEREARPVTVYQLELLGFTSGRHAEGELRISCSAGTYIRTICHDLGRLLGPGAAMSALEREAVGPFRVEDAVPLDELGPSAPLLSLAEALGHLPALRLDPAESLRLSHGQFVPVSAEVPDGAVRVLGADGHLLAIGTVRGQGEARLVAPEKVFSSTDAANSGS